MKVSELISKLQDMQSQHGDLEVVIDDEDEMIAKKIHSIQKYTDSKSVSSIDISVGV